MDKSTKRRLIAAVIIFILTVGAAVAAIVVTMTGANANIRPFGNSTAWTAFTQAFTLQFSKDQALAFYQYASLGEAVLGVVLFLIGLGVVFGRRARFFFLPIGGLAAVAVASFMLQAYYLDNSILILALLVATDAFGFVSLILSFILPKRLFAQKAEEKAVAAPAPVKEEPEPEVKEEPKPEPEPEPEPEPAVVAEPEPESEPESEPKEQPEPEPEEESEPVEEPKPEAKKAPAKKAAAAPVVAPVAAAPAAEDKAKKVVGKYEVFPEAGFFKYRLKANNGEILIVSNPYRTIESAIAGIDTLKKNVPVGRHKVITDKNGYGQFRISTANDARLVATGEIYPSAVGAEKALNSVLKFYDAEKIVTLGEIPESEHREWPLEVEKLDPKTNGKVQIETTTEGKFQATLFANNGELLFATTTYSSKAALTKALENITAKLISGGTVTIAKDKQDRYQFRLYSENGMLLLMGETYPTYEAATKAAHSARNFIKDAKVA